MPTPMIDRLRMSVGDTRSPIRLTLLDGNGEPLDLTSLTVKFVMIDYESKTVVVDHADADVVDATGGIVEYAQQDADVATAGEYAYWFVVYNATDDYDHFPPDGETFRLILATKYGTP